MALNVQYEQFLSSLILSERCFFTVGSVYFQVTPLGLTLKFLSFFSGLVDFMHLDPKKAGTYFSNQQVRNVALIFS